MSDTAAAVNNPLASDPGANRILLMRHAQTKANARGCFLGQRDEGVTELGARQSAAAVEALRTWGPDRIVSSPLKRCRELIAEPAARCLGVPLQVDERLRELDFGPLEGKSFAEVAGLGLPFPWGPTAASWPPPQGGEPFDDFVARLSDAAQDLELLQGRTAVIVHGGVIRGLLGIWLGLDADGVNRLTVENVNSFILRSAPGNMCLERFGIRPRSLGEYR